MINNYQFKLEHFEGPLDLLLKLIENQELDITKVSLSRVADQFVEYVKNSTQLNSEEVADFLVVACKLLLIKSRAILPELNIADEEATDLENQLKIYREYYEATKVMAELINQQRFTFAREKPIRVLNLKFSPPPGLTAGRMAVIFSEAIKRLAPLINLPSQMLKRTISIAEKIRQIEAFIKDKASFSFKKLIQRGERLEVIVSFLALLEMIKQRTVTVHQEKIFEEIEIINMEN